jgi:hypothetical protein
VKKLALILLVLVAVLGAAAYWAWNSLDVIVRVAIEHYAPQVLGVPVKVSRVDISASDGRGTVRDLRIGSPPGFTAPEAARVGEIAVSLDPDTIRAPVVHIRSLSVESPQIAYERGDRGTNIDAIRRNIEGYIQRDGGSSSSRPAEAKPGKRKFIVDRISIRGGLVTMTNPALRGQGLRFSLPAIELRDVGRAQGGLTASEIGRLVVAQLEARIAQRVLTNVETLRKGGVEGAIDALKGLVH